MLSADCRLEGFTTSDWTRVLSLFQPRRASGKERDPTRARGGVVLVHQGGKLLKLLHTQVGRLRRDDVERMLAPAEGGGAPARGMPPIDPEALARQAHASWAAVVELGALDNVMDRFGERARRGDDIATQLLTIAELSLEEVAAGRIALWPRRLAGMPIPSPGMVDATLDTVCPPGKSMLIGLFEGGELWTSLAMRRGRSGFDLILGPDEVRPDMGLLAGDWRRDYRHLSRAIEDRVGGPLALGCFSEATTIKKLVVDATPGAWARAAAVRDVILSPVPLALTIPIGLDVGRAALSALRAVAERADPIGVVGPSIQALKERFSEREVERVLGFHPLELLRRLVSRER